PELRGLQIVSASNQQNVGCNGHVIANDQATPCIQQAMPANDAVFAYDQTVHPQHFRIAPHTRALADFRASQAQPEQTQIVARNLADEDVVNLLPGTQHTITQRRPVEPVQGYQSALQLLAQHDVEAPG